ncbi:hypothetical protein LA080_009221 [Diaporthe eres]|nr:hypothetical protein LA080_009221 [Diaporthe eres]
MAEADADMIQYPLCVSRVGSLEEPRSICAAEILYQLHMENPSTSRQLGVLNGKPLPPNSGLLHGFKPLHVGVEYHQWPRRRPALHMHERHRSGLDTIVRGFALIKRMISLGAVESGVDPIVRFRIPSFMMIMEVQLLGAANDHHWHIIIGTYPSPNIPRFSMENACLLLGDNHQDLSGPSPTVALLARCPRLEALLPYSESSSPKERGNDAAIGTTTNGSMAATLRVTVFASPIFRARTLSRPMANHHPATTHSLLVVARLFSTFDPAPLLRLLCPFMTPHSSFCRGKSLGDVSHRDSTLHAGPHPCRTSSGNKCCQAYCECIQCMDEGRNTMPTITGSGRS